MIAFKLNELTLAFAFRDHIKEIFSNFGTVTFVDVPTERIRTWMNVGNCYVEFEKMEEAEEAIKKMDGGKFKIPVTFKTR